MINIKITFLRSPDECINYSTRAIDCLMMNPEQHVSTENLIAFCAKCGLMQKCRPWLKVKDISQAEFEKAKNENELFEELGALNE